MYNIFVMTKHNSFDQFIDLFILRGISWSVCMHKCVKVHTCHRNLKELVFSIYHESHQDGIQVRHGDRPGKFNH